MAYLVTVKCDRCPTRQEFDPSKEKVVTYVIDDSPLDDDSPPYGAARQRKTTRKTTLPASWGLLELNVGHDKQVQELCPGCVALNRSFMSDPDRLLPERTSEGASDGAEPKKLTAKKSRKKDASD